MPSPLHSVVGRSLTQIGVDRALPRTRAQVDDLREQLATGLRVRRASDDPGSYGQARRLEQVESRLTQVERGLGLADLWSNRTQDELDAVSTLFAEAYETGLRAANGVVDLEPLAAKIESIRSEVIDRLNAQSDGEYLFAGNQTRTQPLQADGTLAAGDFSGQREREIAPGITLAVNIPGSDALMIDGEAAPARLQALADAIRGGDPTVIRDALESVGAGRDHYIDLGARAGTTAQRLDAARSGLEAQKLYTAEARSVAEDADVVEVLGALERQQAALDAALRATAASIQPSLMDYLR